MAEVFMKIKVEMLEEGGYLAASNELQGLVAYRRTVAETLEIAQDVARKLIESCIEHGNSLPPSVLSVQQDASPRRHCQTTVKVPVAIELKEAAV